MGVVEREVVLARPELVAGIKRHCEQQANKGHEAVGFMAERHNSGEVSTLVRLNNHSSDPAVGFFVEPWEQFRAETKLKEAGYKIVGVYHSHTISEARPSKADTAMARPGELMAIYSVAFQELRVYREAGGELVEVGFGPAGGTDD
jgi:proteasome lid subunit RPN8/RPN11